MGASATLPGAFSKPLNPSWGLLGDFLGRLVATLGPVGGVWAASGKALGANRPPKQPPSNHQKLTNDLQEAPTRKTPQNTPKDFQDEPR